MRILYIECTMGVVCSKLTGALFELIPDKNGFLKYFNKAGFENIKLNIEEIKRSGIRSSIATISSKNQEKGNHHHVHRSLSDVISLIDGLNITDFAKESVKKIYEKIADAEGKIHGAAAKDVHFHEVGQDKSIAYVVAAASLFELLEDVYIVASPICVGFGSVECAHGLLPIPAPATAELLAGIPVYSGKTEAELCTPTGAATITYFAKEFINFPPMTIEKIGYGAGEEEFHAVNVLRAYLGSADKKLDSGKGESIHVHDVY